MYHMFLVMPVILDNIHGRYIFPRTSIFETLPAVRKSKAFQNKRSKWPYKHYQRQSKPFRDPVDTRNPMTPEHAHIHSIRF